LNIRILVFIEKIMVIESVERITAKAMYEIQMKKINEMADYIYASLVKCVKLRAERGRSSIEFYMCEENSTPMLGIDVNRVIMYKFPTEDYNNLEVIEILKKRFTLGGFDCELKFTIEKTRPASYIMKVSWGKT
jgi:hypothetical protein